MSDGRFDDIFVAAKSETTQKSKAKTTKLKSVEPDRANAATSKAHDFWSGMDNTTDTIRLNVDIPVALNERLSAKAKKLKQTKAEIVRKLIEWALDE